MHVTGEELEKLIKSVEKEFSAELAVMAKSEDAPFKAKDDKKSEPKEEHDHEEDHEKHEAPEDKEEHEEEHEEHEDHDEKPHEEHEEHHQEAHQEHEEHAPVTADHDYDDEDMEHLHKMYMSMSPGEQRAHHDVLRKCMESSMGKSENEIEEQAPAGPKGPVAEASKVDASRLDKLKKGENPRRGSGGQFGKQDPNNTPGTKSDDSYTKNKELYDEKMKKSDEDGIEEQAPANAKGPKSEASYTPNKELYDMGKSEDYDMLKSEVEAQKAKADTLQKTLDGVTEFLTKLATKANAPKGKAVTSYDVIAKSEGVESVQPMTKAEITATLAKKASDPTLSKSDRDAINAFYWNGADLTSISHLLK